MNFLDVGAEQDAKMSTGVIFSFWDRVGRAPYGVLQRFVKLTL